MSNKYRSLFENLPDAFACHKLIVDSEGHPVDYIFLDVNIAFTEMFGLSKDSVMGKNITEVFPNIKESSFDWIGRFGKVALVGGNIRFEHYYELLDCWYEITAYSDEPGYFSVLFREITKYKQIQEELQKDRNKLATLLEEIFDTATIWIDLLDVDGNITFWNQAAEQISGYKAEEVIGHAKIWEWLYPNPEYRAEIFETVQNIIHKGRRVENFETRIRRKDGQYRTILWHSNNLMENGKIMGSIGLGADITERKQAEEDLKRISDEFEKVFHGTQNAMFLVEVICKNAFRYIRNNQAHEKATGISADHLKGKTPQELVGEALGNRIASNYSQCIQVEAPISYEETLDLPAGKRTWSTTLTPVFSQGEITYIVGSGQDITERKQAEKALQKSEEQYRSLIKYANEAIFIAQGTNYRDYGN